MEIATQQGGNAFIYYWHEYWNDRNSNLVPLHRLHQRSRVMERIGRGDTVWAFARRRTDGAYVIVARYLVSHIGEDPHPDQMSSWRFFESDESGLTPFDPDEQENAEPVIRDLGIATNAQILGMSFEGPNAVREISGDAAEKLRRHAFHQLSPSVADTTPFDPETMTDARAKIVQAITARRGQRDFRDQLLTVYGGRCAITGCGIVDVLEAAHITPYLGPDTNHITNGLLLRADLHTLLDCGLLAINPATRKVVLAKPLLDSADYKELAGCQLRDPEPISATPSPKALKAQLQSSGIVR